MAKTVTKDNKTFERLSDAEAEKKVKKEGYRYISEYERKRLERIKVLTPHTSGAAQ